MIKNLLKQRLNKSNHSLTFLLLLLFSLVLPGSLLIIPESKSKQGSFLTNSLFVYAIEVIVILLFLFLLFKFLESIYISTNKPSINKLYIFYYALPSIAVGFYYLIALYPGIMTNDSFNQWMQVHTHSLYDWHPVPHTIFIYFVTKLWDSPAAIAIAHMTLQSLVLGYILYIFNKLGVNKKLLYLIAILGSLYPSNAVMSIAIWKDIPYNASLSLLTIFILNILITKGKWLDNHLNNVAFICCSVIVVLFRHNGLLSFIGTMFLGLLLLRYKRKTIGLILVSVLSVYILVKGPIYSYLNVKPGTSNEAFGIPTQQIAAVVKNNGYLTPQQKEKINYIMPLDVMAETYHPYSVDLIKFHDEFDRNAIVNDKVGFLKLWFDICIQNPAIVTKAFLDQTSLVWQIKEPLGRGYTFTANRQVVRNDYNIKNKIISEPITSSVYKILDFTEKKENIWLFWRPALLLFIILFAGLLCIRKNDITFLLLVSPVLLNNLSILAAIPAQDYRYLHANNLISIIIVLASFIKLNSNISKEF